MYDFGNSELDLDDLKCLLRLPKKGIKMNERRRFLQTLAISTVALMSPSLLSSKDFFNRAGDIRKIKFQNSNTGERVNTVYWITASNNMNLISKTGENDLINKGAQELKYSLVDKGWDLAFNIGHLYDISKNIKNRYSTSLGFSYNISKIKNDKLAFGLYFQKEKELTIDEKITFQNRLNANFDISKRIAENIQINLSNGYFPNFEKFGDFRLKSTLNLKIKLNTKFSLSINSVFNYDSFPEEGITETDYQLTNSISYTF